jgi:hypothetical protein
VVPLKIASYIGFAAALGAFLRGVYVIAKTLLYGDPVAGYPTIVVLILFLGGLQLMALGIIGEYLARMFVEVKQRPLYFVQTRLAPAQPVTTSAPEPLAEATGLAATPASDAFAGAGFAQGPQSPAPSPVRRP